MTRRLYVVRSEDKPPLMAGEDGEVTTRLHRALKTPDRNVAIAAAVKLRQELPKHRWRITFLERKD